MEIVSTCLNSRQSSLLDLDVVTIPYERRASSSNNIRYSKRESDEPGSCNISQVRKLRKMKMLVVIYADTENLNSARATTQRSHSLLQRFLKTSAQTFWANIDTR
jgi:hypothetical protein